MQKSSGTLFLKSILANSAALFWVKAFMPVSYFIVTVSIARWLGVKNFGDFSLIFSYYVIFKIFTLLGIDTYLIKEIASYNKKAGVYLGNAYIVGSALAAINVLLMNLVFIVAGYSASIKSCGFIISLALFSEPIIRYSESAFVSFSKNKYIFFTVLIREIVKIALTLGVLLVFKDLFLISLSLLFSWYLGAFLNLVFVRRFIVMPEMKFEFNMAKEIVRGSFTLALIGGLSNIFLATDVIVLSKIRGEYDVGLYSAAYKFITLVFLFIDSVGISLLPVLSVSFKGSPEEFKIISERVLKYFVAFATFFIICIFFFSDKLVMLLFGREYLYSAKILSILVWVPLFLGGSYFLGKLFFAANMQKYDLLTLVFACLANLILNIPFTMRWGALGAASATLLSTAIFLALHIYFFSKKVFCIGMRQVFLKPLTAAAVFFFSFLLLSRLNLYFGFISACFIYVSFVAALKIITKDEMAALRELCVGILVKRQPIC